MTENNKKKILVFSTAYHPFVGGAEVAVKEITDRLEDIEFHMITARMRSDIPREEKVGNVYVHRTGVGVPFLDKFILLKFGALKALWLNREHRFDMTWSIMASYAGVAAAFFRIFTPSKKLILTLQEGDEEEHLKRYVFGNNFLYKIFIRPFYNLVFKKADSVTAISNYLIERAVRNGVSREKITRVPNGVDVKRFADFDEEHVKDLRQKFNIEKGEKVVITTSRLVRKNGVDSLVRAMKYVPAGVKLLVVGEGPQDVALHNVARQDNVEDKVIFVGHVDHAELPSYLALADVFVRPSRSEGMGNSFLEAMAARVPVVGTEVGGIPDFLKDTETGLFCKVDDAKDIAEKIHTLLEDTRLREKVVANAKKMVEEKYDWDNIAKTMHTVLHADPASLKKILITTGIYPPDVGGPATYSKLLHDRLPERGFKVRVLSFGHVRKWPFFLRHVLYFLKVLYRTPRVDIVFAQDPLGVGLPSLIAAKIFRKKLVLKVVGDRAWERYMNEGHDFVLPEDFQEKHVGIKTAVVKNIQSFVAYHADVIITPSRYLKGIMRYWGVPAEKVHVIYNGFDSHTVLFDKENLKNQLGFSGHVVVSSGRLVSWKGFSALIEIWPDILKTFPHTMLCIAGNGPEIEKLQKKINDVHLERRIKLLGTLPKDELSHLLAVADVFVLNTGYEGLSHQLLEAMSLGTPIITTNVGGNPELIESEESGILVSYNDKEALKKEVLELLGDEKKAQKLSENALNVVQKFNIDTMLEETIKVLNS